MHHVMVLVCTMGEKGVTQLKCRTDTCGSMTASALLILSFIKGRETLASVLPALKKIF